MRGIYIHIPFCLRKCPYCDFYSVRYDDDLAKKYVDALIRNFRSPRYKGLSADTVYIGGGTPTSLDERLIERLMNGVFDCFDIAEGAEITIEANPCSVNENKLRALRSFGINRISFGIQSADDDELRFLGRLHNFDAAREAVLAASRAGFLNISGDIMAGLSGQDISDLLNSTDKLCSLPLSHISAYMLSIEEGTPFDNDIVRASVADDDKMAELYLAMTDRLQKNGFYQYEISNFSLPGFESRHNLKYWQGDEYIGFGASAHSLFEGKRCYVPRDVHRFILSDCQTEEPEDIPYNERDEYIMLHLRLRSGISLKRLSEYYGDRAADAVRAKAALYEKNGLCLVSGDTVSLTPRGYLLSNSVIAEFQTVCDSHND
ncbi:MAG: radical SAM family heme chaperone HemW [Ruminococcus sp.]|nr:radical SAM family heme chaperone HemW [Ruminococcus sp.]